MEATYRVQAAMILKVVNSEDDKLGRITMNDILAVIRVCAEVALELGATV
jgi:Mg/Co/Ni transporter MgtE